MTSRVGRLVLPEARESASIMGAIQEEIGERLPVTLYPQRSMEQEYAQVRAARGKVHLFQPRDQVARLTRTNTLMGFAGNLRGLRGYDYALDTYHVRRRYGSDEPGVISNTELSVPFMAPNTRSLHLSLNRGDISGESHIPTLLEAQQALRGEYTGELRDMLDTVKAEGSPEYTVIEATLDGIAAASGHHTLPDLQKDYADIADGFREYWQGA
ncbi:MAG TPA: hypothetical protein VFT16_01980 [Candidatus Saccharimonadales bacterium]|nr:hypothetical protein [Candidatus Saccharimonadales bacterium]